MTLREERMLAKMFGKDCQQLLAVGSRAEDVGASWNVHEGRSNAVDEREWCQAFGQIGRRVELRILWLLDQQFRQGGDTGESLAWTM